MLPVFTAVSVRALNDRTSNWESGLTPICSHAVCKVLLDIDLIIHAGGLTEYCNGETVGLIIIGRGFLNSSAPVERNVT